MSELKYDEQKSLKQNLKAYLSWINFNTKKGKENENAILQSQADFVESVVDEYNALIEA